MGIWFTGAALLAFVLLYAGLQRKSALRSGARFGLAILTTIGAVITGFCLYGAVAWGDRGGGVLLLLAMPVGFVTWLFGSALFASAQHESYYDKSVAEKMAFNAELADKLEADLRVRLRELMQQRERFFLPAGRRQKIDEEIARIRTTMRGLPTMRAGLDRPEIYAGDEP